MNIVTPWVRVVDQELVSAGIGVAEESDDYHTAKQKLNSLICWNIQVATDPLVNGGLMLIPKEAIEVLYAAENLVDVRGRYHSELATKRLIEAVKLYRNPK